MDLRETFVKLFTDAARDKPSRSSVQIVDGRWNLSIKGNKPKWSEMLQMAGVPADAVQIFSDDSILVTWPSVADEIFGDGGLMAQALPGYETRVPQLHMARLIQRSIEMGEPAIIEAGTGTGKCLHPDTLITLANGTQCPISVLGHGIKDIVVQADDQLKMRHGAYAQCWPSGVKQTYLLTTRLGHEIKASADHQFLTADGWKRLSELRPGDHVATPRFVPEPMWVYPMPESEIKLLGYMLSDGSCSQSGYRGVIHYTTADPLIVKDLADAVSGLGNTELVRTTGSHAYNIRRIVAREGMEWKRNQAMVLMEETGLAGKKSQSKVIPHCVFSLPNSQLAIFLGCLFSGDGSVSADRRTVEFYSTSRRMLDQIQHLLLRFRVISRVSVKNGRYLGERHQSWRLTISGIANVRLFHEAIQMVGEKQARFASMDFSQPSNINLDIVPKSVLNNHRIPKRFGVNRLHRGVSRRNLGLIADEFDDPRLKTLATSDIYWDEVVSIQPDEIVETYDIEMVGEHNFLADGFIVHNSFAYAAVAMAMNKRCVISTSNKALQAQLYQKDIPFLCKLFPGKKVALAQGKSNYLCRAKCQDRLGNVTIDNYTLSEWYKTTETGNTEELDFQIHGLDKWTVDEDCNGKRCPLYSACFYYKAKAERQEADVIICNHALLILDRLYPQAAILPGCDVVVVDEAHKLADYARNALGQEFTMDGIRNALSIAFDLLREEHDSPTATAEAVLQDFWYDVTAYCGDSKDKQIGIKHNMEFDSGQKLAIELHDIANQIWNPEDMPEEEESTRLMRRANKIHNLADKISVLSLPTADGHVRWIERELSKLVNVPFDVSDFIGRMAGFTTDAPATQDRTRCAYCNEPFTTAVNVLDGKAYGPDCIRHVDFFGDAEIVPLSEWTAQTEEPTVHHDPTAIIFTSATIAAPDLDHFMHECGLSHGFQMVADSPFDYAQNALLYVPNGETPVPTAKEWPAYVIDDVRRLVLSSGGGAFLLFTSYFNMKYAVDHLQHVFEDAGLTVYVQNKLPKGEIAKRFRQDGNAVLFATKSFWEGISIEGAALRLVIIDKMPFQAPSPLLKARESVLDNAFMQLHVPEMVIDLKQGCGRLIRRMDDYGVMAILDSRARLKPYGREKVLPALPPAKLTCSMAEVGEFFEQRRKPNYSNITVDFPLNIDQQVWDELEELGF